jgi:hypothetical protein
MTAGFISMIIEALAVIDIISKEQEFGGKSMAMVY